MKTRNGFVSNSSSSSFIVALDQPATVEYLKNVLFNNEEEIPYYYNSNWRGQETFFSSTELANEVFSALTKYETISPYERDLLEIIKEYDEKGLKLAIEMYKDKICQSHIVGVDDTFEKELYITIHSSSIEKFYLKLFDISGRLVYSEIKQLDGNIFTIQIPTTQFSKGIYILKLYNFHTNFQQKIFIK